MPTLYQVRSRRWCALSTGKLIFEDALSLATWDQASSSRFTPSSTALVFLFAIGRNQDVLNNDCLQTEFDMCDAIIDFLHTLIPLTDDASVSEVEHYALELHID